MVLRLLFTLALAPRAMAGNGCGNGIKEQGEQCDSNDECCVNCQQAADYRTQCQNGQGVCVEGQCHTRQQECSVFNERTFIIGNRSYSGPYTPCQSSTTTNSLTCQVQCHASITTAQNSCINFAQYSNVQNTTVRDGLICTTSSTLTQSTQTSQLGICLQGQCSLNACHNALCNQRGDCYSRSVGTQTQQVQCRCNRGYYGDNCQFASTCAADNQLMDWCGVCGGDNSTCTFDITKQNDLAPTAALIQQPSAQSQFMLIGVPILSSVLPALFIALVAWCTMRYCNGRQKRRSGRRGGIISLSRANSQSSARSAGGLSQSSATSATNMMARKPSQTKGNKLGMSVKFDEYRVTQPYERSMPDEIDLQVGDTIYKLFDYDDGWSNGYNLRTQEEGVYPLSYTQRTDMLHSV